MENTNSAVRCSRVILVLSQPLELTKSTLVWEILVIGSRTETWLSPLNLPRYSIYLIQCTMGLDRRPFWITVPRNCQSYDGNSRDFNSIV